MKEPGQPFIFVAVLVALRFVAAAVLPLSADEAYYWLWSKHLAAGYFDHPPAIAFLIRVGTMLFGNTAFGVRLAPLLLSVAASGFVWRAAAVLLRDERAGGLACLLFNLTLMVAVETMAATPDAPLIACAAAFLFALAKLDETQDGRWWLAVGGAGGLALLSKYTGFFLGLGALVWLVAAPRGRHWLRSPWPYRGALIALVLFAPNLWWNATHHWMTFAFQFGRIGAGHFTLRFLAEFLGAQLVLATPFIFVCAVLGATRNLRAPDALPLVVATLVPAVVYFVLHSLHDRVQGNWPCFLYPALAVAACAAMRADRTGWIAAPALWSRRLAVPVASVLLAACYAQAVFGVVPMGRRDPFARLLAVGFGDVARQVQQAASANGAGAILTTDYASTAWFAFYSGLPVVQLNEEERWLAAPHADAQLLGRPMLYVTEQGRARSDLIAAHFTTMVPLAPVVRSRDGAAIARYLVFRVQGLRGPPVGRAP